ncbi:MAG: imidazolonepropionase-like amidohydrolase [Rhodothermales bacterium]|jgi:imidazolonepropionase-like amidohydrolase
MNTLRKYLVLGCALIATAAPALAQDVLIQGGTVLTITNGTLPGADVLVQNGRITRIGTGITAPDGVEVVDATGKFVMPGIIDAHSHIALSSVNEGTSPVTAEVTMEDVVDPYDISIYRALAGGVTSAHLMHGSANVIGGQNETIKLRYGNTDPDALRFQGAPRTIKFALGENPTRSHGLRGANGGGRPALRPSSRMGVEAVLLETFEAGKRYMEAQDDFRAARRTNPRAVGPAYDQRLEVMADIIRGDVLVHCHSYRADEILMLMRVLKRYGVTKVTFQHANEAFKVAPELAAFGAGASVFSDWWSYKFEVYYSTAYNAAILTRNGVTTSVNSDSGELIRHLYHEAAKAQRYGGLTDDEALALITINPATQLGINNRVGSLEVGKDADLAIFDAHPLSVYAVPVLTFVDGKRAFDRDADPDDMRLEINVTTNPSSESLFEEQETTIHHR